MADPLCNTNKVLNSRALETAAVSSAAVSPASLPLLGSLGRLDPWSYLISFRAPELIQRELIGRTPDWDIHRIEDAYGEINLDYYPVTVTVLPRFATTPEALLSWIRSNINTVIDTELAGFEPYDDQHKTRWLSSNPLGAVVHIDMRLGGAWANPDDGSVVCAEHRADYWIFSTLWTPGDLGHPVSGNRQFGFTRNADGSFTFYTRGADRATGAIDTVASDSIFKGAHDLWLSLQQGIAREVNRAGGSATIGVAISARHNWESVRAGYWRPTGVWVE